jgi:hypothetical protein
MPIASSFDPILKIAPLAIFPEKFAENVAVKLVFEFV